MITTTARDLIVSTFKLIGVTAAGETPSAAEMADAFATLNALVDEWGVHRLTMRSTARWVFDLVVDQQSYTIGDAGDFAIEPPLTLDDCRLILPVDGSAVPTEIPLAILTEDMYAAIQIKALESSYPTQCFYEATTAALGTLWLWPIPTASGLQIVLYVPTTISQFPNVTMEVDLAAGYFKALRYNLALELMAEYTVPPRQDIADLAAKTLSAIKRVNLEMTDLTVDPAIAAYNIGSYNILTDQG